MTYLLSQIFISLLLAAIAGGAIGWIARGLKAHRRERELGGLVNRHASALNQAQQERQMIADDYNEMQLGLESRIGELQVENRKIPELRDNLENSQLLFQQMMKTHESELADSQHQSEQLKLELDGLRVQQKNDHSEIAALRKTNPGNPENRELGGSNSQFESATISDSVSTSNSETESNNVAAVPTDVRRVVPSQSASGNAPEKRFAETTATSQSQAISRDDASGHDETANDLNDVIGESADRAAVTQAELLELESEIEEMRGYNRDHGYSSTQDELSGSTVDSKTTNNAHGDRSVPDGRSDDGRSVPGSLSTQGRKSSASTTTSNAAVAASAVAATSATAVRSSTHPAGTTGNQRPLSTQDSVDPEFSDPSSSPAMPSAASSSAASASVNHEASVVAELREHFSAGGDPEATDDLQTIHGIGPVMEQSLNNIGITNYHQIAELTRREIEDIAEILEIFPGRIERDNWIGSARKLAGDSSVQTADNRNNEARKEADNPALQAEEFS